MARELRLTVSTAGGHRYYQESSGRVALLGYLASVVSRGVTRAPMMVKLVVLVRALQS